MSQPGDSDDTPGPDDVLGRADALLNRHRAGLKPEANTRAIPTLSEPIAENFDASAIPTLTDIVETPMRTVRGAAEPPRETPPESAHSGEIISRVQAQNLEHGGYQKLKQGLDAQIAEVLQSRFMPDIAGALDQALHKINTELKTNINAMVRESIEETLQKQLQQLRLTDASAAAAPADTKE